MAILQSIPGFRKKDMKAMKSMMRENYIELKAQYPNASLSELASLAGKKLRTDVSKKIDEATKRRGRKKGKRKARQRLSEAKRKKQSK